MSDGPVEPVDSFSSTAHLDGSLRFDTREDEWYYS